MKIGKHILARFTLLFFLLGIFTGAKKARTENYPWHAGASGYDIALKQQKASGQPFLAYFYAPWCPYCKTFERNILNSEKVKEGLAGVIKVKLDAEKERKISEQFGVTGFPRVFVIFPHSRRAKRLTTDTNIKKFLTDCQAAGLKVKV